MLQFLDEIEEHFKENYPREGCGLLAVVKGELQWFPCTNVAEHEDDFILDSTEYLNISRKSDIVGIVHSHPDASCDPSESDIKHCNAIGIPYYIFSYPGMDVHVQQPEKESKPLYGREYEFGVSDCFEAMRDYSFTKYRHTFSCCFRRRLVGEEIRLLYRRNNSRLWV